MVLFRYIVLSVLLYVVDATPVSYQYVNFIRNGRAKTDLDGSRRSRSFRFENRGFSSSHFWSDGDLQPHRNSLVFEEHRGHITPDFSNGLEYPDPYLLTGPAARRAAVYLYKKPLFFGEINHTESLQRNQQERIHSGLAGNKLGSLRTHLPFYRFKKFYQGFFK